MYLAIGPILPIARVDFMYQHISENIHAIDGRGEIGYGGLGLSYRRTQYVERFPRDRLDLIEKFVLFRLNGISIQDYDLSAHF